MASVEDFVSANQQLMECDVLDVDAMRLMYRLELAGETFYEMLASGVDNEEAATLLRKNGREETKHSERVNAAYELLVQAASSGASSTSTASASPSA